MKGKNLYFGMSVALPLEEAVEFKKSLGDGDKYFLLKVKNDPKNVHIDRRSLYMVLREPRRDELIRDAYTVYCDENDLV